MIQASPLPVISMGLEFLLGMRVVCEADRHKNMALGVIKSALNSALWLLVLLEAPLGNAGHGLTCSGRTGKF